MKIITRVHPNSKKPRIEKDLAGLLHIYINQPPLKGRATQAAIEILAKYLETKKNKILLVSGAKSRNKIFDITQE